MVGRRHGLLTSEQQVDMINLVNLKNMIFLRLANTLVSEAIILQTITRIVTKDKYPVSSLAHKNVIKTQHVLHLTTSRWKEESVN